MHHTKLYILLLSFFCTCLSAQNGSAFFTVLTKETGRANGTFHTSLVDSKGFVWLGLEDRLIRWDGRHTKEFTTIKGDSTSLSCTFVRELLEDIDGTIWVATIGGGVCQFDPQTQRFKRYSYEVNNQKSISETNVWTLYLDSQKNLWLGTFNGGLSRFNRQTHTFDRFPLVQNLKNENDAFRLNTVRAITEDISNPNILWLATNEGIVRFEKSSGKTRLFISTATNTAGMTAFSVVMDTPNELWVGTWGGGVVRFDTQSYQWTYFTPNTEGWSKRNAQANIIEQILPKNAHELWVCSIDMGFGTLNRQTGNFQFFKNDPENIGSIGANTANSVHKDAKNRLWITHANKGVSMLDLNGMPFAMQELPSSNCPLLAEARVTGFEFDPIRQSYFVTGSACDGFFMFDKNKQFIKQIQAVGDEGKYTFYQSVKVANNGTVWVGGMSVYSASLWFMPPNTDKLQPFKHRLLPKKAFNVQGMHHDGKGLWLATDYFGLMHIDFEHDTIISYVKSAEFPNAPSEYVHVRHIVSDGKDRLWLATQGEGVFCFDTKTKQFKQWLNLKTGFNGTVETRVHALAIDNQGLVWLASSGNGVQILDPNNTKEPIIAQLGPDEGLPSPRINNIVCDKSGQIWVTTEGGVCRYDKPTKRFITYGQHDGLINNHFYEQGLAAFPNGELMVGNDSRFYTFDTKKQANNQQNSLVFSTFRVFEQLRAFGKDLNYLEQIKLLYNENYFTIAFSDLTFPQATGSPFAYRLEGFDADWIYPKNDRSEAIYTGVPPGNYTFRVKLAGNEGTDNTKSIALKIAISPPLWRTLWAYWAYALALGFVGYRVYRFNQNRQLEKAEAKKAYEQQLIQTVKERTEELRVSLTEKEFLLKEVHHRVKNNLEVISSLLTLQTSNILDEKAKAALAESQSRVQSIALIHHKLYRNDELSTVELNGFATDLFKQVSDLFKKQGESIEFNVIGTDMHIDTNTAVPLGLILNELFTNAFKYAVKPDMDNKLSLFLEKIEENTEGGQNGKQDFKITFRDNGSGLPDGFRIEKTSSLGMKVIKLLTKQIGGSLQFYNENGAVFDIRFSSAALKAA
jgi:two-component sensor histidine kinase/ligand-binding sensor domain-containing protein